MLASPLGWRLLTNFVRLAGRLIDFFGLRTYIKDHAAATQLYNSQKEDVMIEILFKEEEIKENLQKNSS